MPMMQLDGFWIALGAFAVLALLEGAWPARRPQAAFLARWRDNGLLYLAGLGAVALMPFTAAAAASWAEARGFGLLHVVQWPEAFEAALALLALDLAAYGMHRAMHLGWLWRVHAVHHCDTEPDVSTAVRHHPVEALLAVPVYAATAVVVGADWRWLALYSALSLVFALIAHVNATMPSRVDWLLRALIVTPSVHFVHHSGDWSDSNSNFGMVLTVWDRAFGSYRVPPGSAGAATPRGIGLPATQVNGIGPLLLLPRHVRPEEPPMAQRN